MVQRIYVERNSEADCSLELVRKEIFHLCKIITPSVRRIMRFDIEGVEEQELNLLLDGVLSEPGIDRVFFDLDDKVYDKGVVVEYLDGQYDQKADVVAQSIQFSLVIEKPIVKYATIYVFEGNSKEDIEKIKGYLINPVDAREGDRKLKTTLKKAKVEKGKMREDVLGFITLDAEELKEFFYDFSFAMTFEDLVFVQEYFRSLKREPSHTELKVIDTYWSDHCRHSTFFTQIKDVKIFSKNENIEKSFEKYSNLHNELYKDRRDKYPCLMDIATIAVKKLRQEGYLSAIEESEEINACSVVVELDNDGEKEEWIIMFKNETHNHPTEIEPLGGASTCLGGAIRDPLSGRSYVYQGMRVTGAGNPLEDVDNTLKGKLPQRFLTKTALQGFSSYGNQIGVPAGQAVELYNERFRAKRLEAGYVIGGAKRDNVVRKTPKEGDFVILVGGETGRDGCGGATGSSKAHTTSSLDLGGAEVQKGNPPEERKLTRLYRDSEASKLIIKSNDFGAGGVCVAIGELAPGLDIYLDRVLLKYDDLTATEIAISESQERMAVVVHEKDASRFLEIAARENLKATVVAEVTSTQKLKMFYREEIIADIDRAFLDTNGVRQVQDVTISEENVRYFDALDEEVWELLKEDAIGEAIKLEVASMSNCSQKGLGEIFDATIGAGSVLLPFGGKEQLTPSMIMATKPPVSGFTHTVTCSSYGINPKLMIESPYTGAIYSVVTAVAKLVASGVSYDSIYLTFQEYFLRTGKDPLRWGQPLSALLGALEGQLNLKVGAIGGKDSMSGTFEDIDVPPTLIAFAMGIASDKTIVHNVFGNEGKVYRFRIKKDVHAFPDFKGLKEDYAYIAKKIEKGKVVNATVVETSTIATLVKSLLGNMVGINLTKLDRDMFLPAMGDIIVITPKNEELDRGEYIGELNNLPKIIYPQDSQDSKKARSIDLEDIKDAYLGTLSKVFPLEREDIGEKVETISCKTTDYPRIKKDKITPNVLLPIFPGSNSEYDLIKKFEDAGAKVSSLVICNDTKGQINQSIEKLIGHIREAQIVVFPSGFSLGNEGIGCGKYIFSLFKNEKLQEELLEHLYERDGLILGVNTGMQALVSLGLLPNGKFARDLGTTLLCNEIGRHISTMLKVRVASVKSPWMKSFNVGDIFSVPVSTDMGRFTTSKESLAELQKNGQIITQYVDLANKASMHPKYNPFNSMHAVEGLISPDGRVLGRVGHSERWQKGLYQNVPGNYAMDVIKNGVDYFS